jgi:DnaJ-class molecular chaperone
MTEKKNEPFEMSERVQLYKECSICNGTGVVYDHDWKDWNTTAPLSPIASTCQVCHGSGYEPTQYFFFSLGGGEGNKYTMKPGMKNFESEPE